MADVLFDLFKDLVPSVLRAVWSALVGSLPIGALLALLAFFSREWIRQVLTKWVTLDIEKEKSKAMQALEDKRASAQMQLEAYKASLIGEAEATKAHVDLRKQIAVGHELARYDALVALHRVLDKAPSVIWGSAQSSAQHASSPAIAQLLPSWFKRAEEELEELIRAHARAGLFLPVQMKLKILAIIQGLREVVYSHLNPVVVASQTPMAIEETKIDASRDAVAGIITSLEDAIERLVQVSAPMPIASGAVEADRRSYD